MARVKTIWRRFRRWLTLILPVVVALAVGYLGRGWFGTSGQAPDGAGDAGTSAMSSAPESVIYTCSMHPQIQQPNPGQCPICGMDLIPVEGSDESEREAPTLELNRYARQLAQVQVTPVQRAVATKTVNMVGKVEYDETRVETITAWVPGRLERLFVDYTGIPVKKGDHMVSMYSPDVLTAQQELLQAIETVEELQDSDVSIVRETAEATVESARDKLRLLGLTAEQIAQIEARGTPSDSVTIYAPRGGIVIHKNAVEGMYVDVGTRIYTIADMSQLWVKLEAYESDLEWIRYAQDVAFTTEAYPGETFHGRIAFIEPFLTERTRTVRIRVNVPNEDGRLKPGMLVRARVDSRLAGDGRVLEPQLAGKWVSPMHPEIIRDEPGDCPICGMPLVKAETLGFVSKDAALTPPLLIPASAPLVTGQRAVVYIQDPDDPGRFVGREIVLGQRAGQTYIVEQGLTEGELVVTQGAFKIDSALQILAKPSMMNPVEETAVPAVEKGDASSPSGRKEGPESAGAFDVPNSFTEQLAAVTEAYLSLQKALSQDDLNASTRAAAKLNNVLQTVDMGLLKGDAHMAWMDLAGELRTATHRVHGAGDLETARRHFAALSEAFASAVRRFGQGLSSTMVQMRCPMAFDNRGAIWVQDHTEVENPYFGAAMFRCGEVTDKLTTGDTRATEEHQNNE